MTRLIRWLACGTLALLVAMGSDTVASKTIPEGSWAVMAYGGVYSPGPGGVDDEATFGVRAGYALSNQLIVSGSLGRVSFDQVDADITLLDVNVGYAFRPDKRLSLVVTGGIGSAFISNGGFDDSFTLNVGFGPAIGITDRLFVRLLNRFRWYENRTDDEIDREITLGIAYRLGQ